MRSWYLITAAAGGLVVVACVIIGSMQAEQARSDAFMAQLDEEIAEQRGQEAAARNAVLAAAESLLATASPDRIRALLLACRERVSERAQEDNKTGFGVFMADEEAPDVFQGLAAASGGNANPIAKRVEIFQITQKRGQHLALSVEGLMKFTAIFTGDSFSGTRKFPVTYSCTLGPKLSIASVSKL